MKLLAFPLSLAIAIFSHLHAWNEKGHGVITQGSYQLMTNESQQAINKLVLPLYYNSINASTRHSLEKTLPDGNEYARLVLLPDFWMHNSAREFFNALNATLPNIIEDLADKPIMGWHFIDLPYPHYKQCAFNVLHANAVEILNVFENVINEHLDPQTQAAILILWTHILEDLHQPLHGVSGVQKDCGGDSGGNLVCGIHQKNGSCKYNLHTLYDGGMLYNGTLFFDTYKSINETAIQLYNDFPIDYYPVSTLSNTNPESWDYEDYQLANFVYSFEDTPNSTNQDLPMEYRHKARSICEERAALASYRLAVVITEYFLTSKPSQDKIELIEKLTHSLQPRFIDIIKKGYYQHHLE